MAKRKTAAATRRKPRTGPAQRKFDCIPFKQGGKTLACFVCSAKKLWDIVQINKREEDKEKGYQRALSVSRAAKLAKFIDAGNVLPNSVLVTFDKGTINEASGTLTVPNKPDAGWVIDGQHRLEGAHRAGIDIQLPVIAFVKLDEIEQINCFVTINREQKGVPSSLYFDLLKHLPGQKSPTQLTQERATDIADSLRQDEKSPFFQRIVATTSPKKGEISLTHFVKRAAPLITRTTGRLEIYNDEDRAGAINNYYRALGRVFRTEYKSENSIFFKTTGFGALMRVLPLALDLCLQHYKGFEIKSIQQLFERIDDFEFDKWHEKGTGNAAEIVTADDLRTAIQASFDTATSSTLKLR
jgi:DGQHR domain-containing protein